MTGIVGTAGVVLIVAAVIGGGFVLAGIDVPVISSVRRQLVVGIVGAALLAVDLTYVSGKNDSASPAEESATTVQVTTTPTSSPRSTPAPPATTEPPISCSEARRDPVRSATVADVDPAGGIDLDCGQTTLLETDPGADISGRQVGAWLDVVSQDGGVAWVDSLAPDDFARCAGLPADAWAKSLRGLAEALTDRNICVRTSEGNLAIIVLDRPSTPAVPRLKFHYRIQYR